MSTDITVLESRKAEVAQYDTNIVTYQTIVSTLPSEWPAHLEKYRGTTDTKAVVSEVVNLDDLELVSRLLFREQCERQIRLEIMERAKASAILAVLEANQ